MNKNQAKIFNSLINEIWVYLKPQRKRFNSFKNKYKKDNSPNSIR